MDYLRPKTVDEAIEHLGKGIPLGGGTKLAAQPTVDQVVVDLQDLGWDVLEERGGLIHAGAMTRLQQLLEGDMGLPEALKQACRHEAAWNIRNQATLGGLVASADGTSPLLTVLASLHTQLALAPGDEPMGMLEFKENRAQASPPLLIKELIFARPTCLAYDYVARTPMDRPQVCAAAARFEGEGDPALTFALGGHGLVPFFWMLKPGEPVEGIDPADLGEIAADFYRSAGDPFASAEYRSAIAAVLVKRVTSEVIDSC